MNEIMQKTLEYLEVDLIDAMKCADYYRDNWKRIEDRVLNLKLSIDAIRKSLDESN